MVTMYYVGLSGNQFTGTLPPLWGQQGYWYEGQLNVTQELSQL